MKNVIAFETKHAFYGWLHVCEEFIAKQAYMTGLTEKMERQTCDHVRYICRSKLVATRCPWAYSAVLDIKACTSTPTGMT